MDYFFTACHFCLDNQANSWYMEYRSCQEGE